MKNIILKGESNFGDKRFFPERMKNAILFLTEFVFMLIIILKRKNHFVIHSDQGLTLETSVFECFTVGNLPYRPCG